MLTELVALGVAAAACSGEVADGSGVSSVGGSTSSGGGNASSSGGGSGTGGTLASGGTNEGGASANACATALPLSSIAEGTACAYLSALGASVSSVTLWVADSSTNSGGHFVTLPQNQEVTSQGHTYRLSGSDSLFGSGLVGGVSPAIFGYLELSVDEVAAQIRLDVAGCATEVSPGYAYAFASRVTLARPGCSTCMTDTVRRDFLVTRLGSQYIFQNASGPQACSTGIGLVDMTL